MSTAAHVTHAERLANARRVVIKIGSALFVDQQTGALDRAWLEGVCADVADLRRAGKDVVIVSSGAVALGRARAEAFRAACGSRRARRRRRSGQILLAHAYQEILRGLGHQRRRRCC